MSDKLEQLKNDFAYHQCPPAAVEMMAAVRTQLLQSAKQIVGCSQSCREQSLALTKLEEAMFWANAAISRPHPIV